MLADVTANLVPVGIPELFVVKYAYMEGINNTDLTYRCHRTLTSLCRHVSSAFVPIGNEYGVPFCAGLGLLPRLVLPFGIWSPTAYPLVPLGMRPVPSTATGLCVYIGGAGSFFLSSPTLIGSRGILDSPIALARLSAFSDSDVRSYRYKPRKVSANPAP